MTQLSFKYKVRQYTKKKPNANSSNKRFTDSAIRYAFIASVNFLIPVRQ